MVIAWLSAMVDWLSQPLSGSHRAALESWVYWHARYMVLGWNVLLPSGMLVARFFKVIPGQDWPNVLDCKVWWRTHVWLQSVGIAAMTLGVALAFGRGKLATNAALLHHVAGWTLAAAGAVQVLGALLRGDKGGPTAETLRGDHYDMTLRRVVFESVHKFLGWAAVPIVIGATGLGLTIVDAPRWMALTLACWWILLFGAFVRWQSSGRCLDTYQAIWGPDPAHPGNRRRPIGWGVVQR